MTSCTDPQNSAKAAALIDETALSALPALLEHPSTLPHVSLCELDAFLRSLPESTLVAIQRLVPARSLVTFDDKTSETVLCVSDDATEFNQVDLRSSALGFLSVSDARLLLAPALRLRPCALVTLDRSLLALPRVVLKFHANPGKLYETAINPYRAVCSLLVLEEVVAISNRNVGSGYPGAGLAKLLCSKISLDDDVVGKMALSADEAKRCAQEKLNMLPPCFYIGSRCFTEAGLHLAFPRLRSESDWKNLFYANAAHVGVHDCLVENATMAKHFGNGSLSLVDRLLAAR
ncbi:Hypothetical protein UVM_LOCUS206 [uncultured virus]|nr:Hypothetical protein UVM_LOCUS206 [uncultured virus]